MVTEQYKRQHILFMMKLTWTEREAHDAMWYTDSNETVTFVEVESILGI